MMTREGAEADMTQRTRRGLVPRGDVPGLRGDADRAALSANDAAGRRCESRAEPRDAHGLESDVGLASMRARGRAAARMGK